MFEMVGDVTVLTGRSGAQFHFMIHPRQQRFVARGGVFVLGRSEGADRYAFCYVGESADISVRPFVKDKEACFNAFRADHVFMLDEQSAARRAEIVADLIAAYAPSCNTI
jgi:hypothetical protein